MPSVAELPICQKTLQAWAPPVSSTRLLEAVVSVEPIWKMKTALGSPWSVERHVAGQQERGRALCSTPGVRNNPPRSPGRAANGSPSGGVVVGRRQVGLRLCGDGVSGVNRSVHRSGRKPGDRGSRDSGPRSPLITLGPGVRDRRPTQDGEAVGRAEADGRLGCLGDGRDRQHQQQRQDERDGLAQSVPGTGHVCPFTRDAARRAGRDRHRPAGGGSAGTSGARRRSTDSLAADVRSMARPHTAGRRGPGQRARYLPKIYFSRYHGTPFGYLAPAPVRQASS